MRRRCDGDAMAMQHVAQTAMQQRRNRRGIRRNMRRYLISNMYEDDTYISVYLQVFLEKYMHVIAHSNISAAPHRAGICKYVFLRMPPVAEWSGGHILFLWSGRRGFNPCQLRRT